VSQIGDILVQKFRSILLGPKDYFERQKQKAVRWMILPLFAMFAGPALFSSFLSQVQSLKVLSGASFLELIAGATYDNLFFAGSIVAVYGCSLLLNFFYALKINASERELGTVGEQAQRIATYEALKVNFRAFPTTGNVDKALFGKFVIESFPELARADAPFVAEVLALPPPSPSSVGLLPLPLNQIPTAVPIAVSAGTNAQRPG
jgi:hypothetical protein